MRPMTDAQFYSGIAVMLGAILTLVIGFLLHWKKINDDILKDDRQKLVQWAQGYARQLAHEMLVKYLRSVVVTIPVQLINESDISWGENKEEEKQS